MAAAMRTRRNWNRVLRKVESLGGLLSDHVGSWAPGCCQGSVTQVILISDQLRTALGYFCESDIPIPFHGHPPVLARVCLELKVPANLLKLLLWMLPVASPLGGQGQLDRLPLDVRRQIHALWRLALAVFGSTISTIAFTYSQAGLLMDQFDSATGGAGAPGEAVRWVIWYYQGQFAFLHLEWSIILTVALKMNSAFLLCFIMLLFRGKHFER